MDRPQSLRPNKQAKIEIIKEQLEKVFNHIDANENLKTKIRIYYDSLKYLKNEETMLLCSFLQHVLNLPEYSAKSEIYRNKESMIYNPLKKAEQRKQKYEHFKQYTLKQRCLDKLRYISIESFNTLSHNLQRDLVEKTKRIDLAYAYAQNSTLTIPIARLIVNQIKESEAKKVGYRNYINKVILPPKILKHGNKKLLAYALLNTE